MATVATGVAASCATDSPLTTTLGLALTQSAATATSTTFFLYSRGITSKSVHFYISDTDFNFLRISGNNLK
jgi:hypothetical protein